LARSIVFIARYRILFSEKTITLFSSKGTKERISVRGERR